MSTETKKRQPKSTKNWKVMPPGTTAKQLTAEAKKQVKKSQAAKKPKPDSPTKKRKKFKDAQAKAAAAKARSEALKKEHAELQATQLAELEAQNKATGRPSEYTPEVAQRFCAAIASGLSVRTACKPDDMPSVATIFNWFSNHPSFLEQYKHAREMRTEAFAEDILDIADDSTNDYMEIQNDDGSTYERYNPENVARAKLRIDTRQYLMAVHNKKTYAPKTDQGPPIVVAPIIYAPRELKYNQAQPERDYIDGQESVTEDSQSQAQAKSTGVPSAPDGDVLPTTPDADQ